MLNQELTISRWWTSRWKKRPNNMSIILLWQNSRQKTIFEPSRLWWIFKFGYTGLKRMKFFLCVVGMVMIIEGLPYFAFPEKMKFWIQKISETPDGSLRRFGLVLMLLGLVFVYLGKNWRFPPFTLRAMVGRQATLTSGILGISLLCTV